jgi:hypothetical protein
MNFWDIPMWLEQEVRERDKTCVYCGVPMARSGMPGGSRCTVATWEHIVNDARIVTRENIALCCVSCNSSKGPKLLSAWLQSSYCKKRGITAQSVAPVVRLALEAALSSEPNNLLHATGETRAREQ